MKQSKHTKHFASRWGFILASVGSAVGMANVWGFPNKLAVFDLGAPDGGAWLLLCLKQYGLQLAVCFVLCTDLGKKLWQTLGGARAGRALRYAVLALVFFLSVLTLTGSGMQAFIYARF